MTMNKTSDSQQPAQFMLARTSPSALSVLVTLDVPDFVTQMLSNSGLGVKRVTAEDLPEAVANNTGQSHLFWDLPSEAIATALKSGEDTAAILAAWLDRHRALLGFLRRNRRKLKLLDSRIMYPQADPSDRSRLASTLGVESLPLVLHKSQIPGSALAMMLSMLILSRLDALRDCIDELEASSVTFGSDRLTSSWLNSAAIGFSDIHQISESLARSSEKARLQGQDLSEARAKCEKLNEKLAALEASAQKSEQEIRILRDQLRLDQSELQLALNEQEDRYSTEIEDLKEKLSTSEKAREDLQHSHQTQKKKYDKKIIQLSEEASSLRDQLGIQIEELSHQRQDMIIQEKKRNKAAYESEQALSRALIDLRREARDRNTLNVQLQDMEARLLSVEEERDILVQQIKEIYASRSWRITKPLRQARLIVAPIKDDV